MANLPNDPFTPLPAPPATNTDLPGAEFPSMSRIVATDLVGPDAANRQHVVSERRSMTLRDRVNKLIEFANVIDEIMLRRDGTAQKDATAGFTGDIPANNHSVTGLRAAIAPGEAVRYEEFAAALQAIAQFAAVPTGMVGSFPAASPPNGWIVADGSLYTLSNIVTAEGSTIAYPGGLSWGAVGPLRAVLGSLWGGDGINTFRVPDYRGRVVLGSGVGVIGGALTSRSPGQYGGEENHVLTEAELAAHKHWMVGDDNYGATSWGAAIGAGDTRPIALRANSGVGGSDEKYSLNAVRSGEADRAKSGAAGGNVGHNNMQPFATALICLKL